MVNDKEVRFDFTHFSALTPEEITKVEQEVNLIIRRAIDVECREMPIEEAKKLGAMHCLAKSTEILYVLYLLVIIPENSAAVHTWIILPKSACLK